MTGPVVSSDGGVTLVGGGALTESELAQALLHAPVLVAADGGADAALALGAMPDAVIGDFDSLSADARGRIPPDRLHHVAEQNSTDFTKCLTRIRARFVLAVGFSGRRLDHTLAALSSLVEHPDPPCLLIAAEDLVFLAPPQLRLDLAAGTRVSLYPLGPSRGTSTGLRWPIDGLEFAPAGRVGTSNAATGPVELRLEGSMLVLLPRDCLAQAMTGLGV
ncbi:thiamine diphosphokinase [Paracoccus pacificus]|uniref:Thiamine diphosphokinase n=1 Tax=Paracoccus pacificus TaxID=1463598 RepID=A0ABW4R976_9RHOB